MSKENTKKITCMRHDKCPVFAQVLKIGENAHLFGLGSPIGVRLVSGLGTVLRIRIWETFLDRSPAWSPTLAS